MTVAMNAMTHFCTVSMRKILKTMIAKTELITTTIRKQTKAPGEIRYKTDTLEFVMDMTNLFMPKEEKSKTSSSNKQKLKVFGFHSGGYNL